MQPARRLYRRESEESRRSALIAATQELVAEGGPEAATVRAISERAGVTPGLIRHYFQSKDELTRAAYHLGNRHVALQVGDGWLRLLDDYVLQAMLEQLGARTERIEAGFQPEHGAYGGGHHHSRHGDEDFNYAPKLHQFGVRL